MAVKNNAPVTLPTQKQINRAASDEVGNRVAAGENGETKQPPAQEKKAGWGAKAADAMGNWGAKSKVSKPEGG